MIYDDAQDALAAEYVLGTLSGDEREHAEALLAIDPGFAESVRLWERRLGELNVMVEAVEPPPEVWDRIKAELGDAAPSGGISSGEIPAAAVSHAASPTPSIEPSLQPSAEPASIPTTPAEPFAPLIPDESGDEFPDGFPNDLKSSSLSGEPRSDAVPDSIAASLAKALAEPSAEAPPSVRPPAPQRIERSADVIYLSRRVARWRGVTVAFGALAAALALYIAVAQFAPGLIPFGPHTPQVVAQSQAPAALAARLVAVLQQDPTAPAFLLTVDPQSRTLVVRRVSATPEQGRSYELWLVSKQFPAPRSLGVVGNDEFTQRPIPGNFDIATVRSASYAVSLEPAGGSPSGVPTGPVLFTGNIVESVPTSPRT